MKKVTLILLCCFAYIFSTAQENVSEALAYQYYQQGKFQEAATLFEQMFNVSRNDNHFDLYVLSMLKIKKFDEAEKTIKKQIRSFPKSLQYPLALARLYQEKGQSDQATKIYSEVLSKLPADEFKIRELANQFYGFQAYDMAIATFLQGRKIMNNENLFAYELLSIYRFKKDKSMLIVEYINALGEMPELLPQAESVLSSVFEDNADYIPLQTALLKKIQREPQKEIYTKLLIWQYLQQQEYETALRQLIAQDKRIKDDGAILFNAANTFLTNKSYSTAIKAFEYLISKGKESPWFLPAKVEMIDAQYHLVVSGQYNKAAISDLATNYKSLLDEYGRTTQTIFAVKKLARLQAYYLDELPQAEKSLETALTIPGIPNNELAEIKLDLGDIYILTEQPWEAFLIYEQVAKQLEGQPVANEAHYRAAKLSFYQGNFAYAKSQVDVLKASTSQLIANDALNLSLLISDNLQSTLDSNALKMYADAERLQFSNRTSQALSKLDSIEIAFPNNSLLDDILMAKSKIYIRTGEFSIASKMLEQLINQHRNSVWIDDALFTLADLYENNLKDIPRARVLYQTLINDHPGSMFTTEARKRFRKLRGDNIGT